LIATLENNIDRTQRENEVLTTRLHTEAAETELRREQFNRVQGQLDGVQGQLDDQLEVTDTQNEQVRILREQVRDRNSTIQTLEGSIEVQGIAITDSNAARDNALRDRDQARLDHDGMRTQRDQQGDTHRAALNRANRELNDLRLQQQVQQQGFEVDRTSLVQRRGRHTCRRTSQADPDR